MRLLTNDLAFVGLGSNLGDCEDNLKNAVQLLKIKLNAEVVVSSLYRSEPVELTEQPWFCNQVACFDPGATMGPVLLLQKLKEIEVALGRTPGLRYGPRVIDLDLLLYKNWVYECDFLSVPHPKMEFRSFVLLPLMEIAPDLVNPRNGRKIREILAEKQGQLSFCEKMPD